MISIAELLERHKHPLTWLYSLLFYINLFTGMWLHNWLIISASLLGILAVTLFQPAIKTVPAWSEKLIAITLKQWQSMPSLYRIATVSASLLITFGLLCALWRNNVTLTVLFIVMIVALKAYFLQKPLREMAASIAKLRKKASDKGASSPKDDK